VLPRTSAFLLQYLYAPVSTCKPLKKPHIAPCDKTLSRRIGFFFFFFFGFFWLGGCLPPGIPNQRVWGRFKRWRKRKGGSWGRTARGKGNSFVNASNFSLLAPQNLRISVWLITSGIDQVSLAARLLTAFLPRFGNKEVVSILFEKRKK